MSCTGCAKRRAAIATTAAATVKGTKSVIGAATKRASAMPADVVAMAARFAQIRRTPLR